MTGLNRRTIMGGDAPSYRGPEQIQDYYDSANKIIKRKVRGVTKKQPCPYPQDSQRHFLMLWASGCREGEAIMVNPNDFKWTATGFGSPKLPVLKKRERVKHKGQIVYKEVKSLVRQMDGSIQEQIIYRPESKQKIEYREHLIRRDLPLVEEFIKVLEPLQENGYKYVLYKHGPFQRIPIPDRPCSTTIVQDRINELHPDLFPHGIRALLARCLYEEAKKKEGIKKFDLPELKNLYKWSTVEMAVHYLGGQKMAEAMDVDKPW